MRRALSPGGRLLFVEHGRAPEPRVARWQELLDPLWLRLSGGCHLSRKIDDLLSDAGFRIEGLKTGYIPGPKIMTFLYEGTARPRYMGDPSRLPSAVLAPDSRRVAAET